MAAFFISCYSPNHATRPGVEMRLGYSAVSTLKPGAYHPGHFQEQKLTRSGEWITIDQPVTMVDWWIP
ncbi:hypothetical protein RRG08_013370 [Elysia crispata]|uniref:Uncharacterized protein n=1 Tax=Elysia crispata TaxID=231223 RepID=A0AAE0YRZ8_9GAST|nr:hypothetical protein RRG08_013370 [Elysia crispata]